MRITKKWPKWMERGAEDGEKKLEAYIESMIDGIGVTDTNGNILQVNSAFAEMHGYSQEKMIGMPIFELVPERELLRIKKIFVESIKQKKKSFKNLEVFHKRKDGSEFPAMQNITRLFDEKGEVIRGIVVIRDVTESMKSEEKLRDKSQLLNAILSNISMCTSRCDENGIFTSSSGSGLKKWGLKEGELVGKSVFEIAPHLKAKMERVMEGESVQFFDSGEYKGQPTHFKNFLFPDHERGKGVYNIALDVTEEKKAEEKIRESEERYRTIFNSVNDMIITQDSITGEILDINKATLQQTGYTEKEFRELGVAGFSPKTAEFNPERIIELIKKAAMGQPQNYDWGFIDKQGKLHRTKVSLTRAKFQDKYQLIAVARDITRQKKSEERLRQSEKKYRTLVSNIPGAIYSCSADWTITFMNEPIKRITGYPASDFIDNKVRTFASIMNPDDVKVVEKTVQDAIQRKESHYFTEYRITHKDGSERWISDRVRIFYGQDGNHLGFEGIILEITERKKAEQELQKINQDLRKSRIATLNILEDTKKAQEEIKSLKEYSENLVANIPSAIIVFDKDLKYVSANYTYNKTYNITPGKTIGRTIYDILPSKLLDLLKIDKKILQAFKTGEIVQDINVEFDTPFAGKRILNIKYVPIAKWKAATTTTTTSNVMVVIDDVTKFKKLEKQKRVLTEKVAKLIRKVPLTKIEKLVFYGLVKHPLFTDRQLSDTFDVKRSTVTAIKNKLLKQGFYTPCIIPNFAQLGCELICTVSGKTLAQESVLRQAPQTVFILETDENFFSIVIGRKFIDVKQLLDTLVTKYETFELESPHVNYFPCAISNLTHFFQYENLMQRLLELGLPEERIQKQSLSPGRKLSKNEQMVLFALTRYPGLIDVKIAEKTGLSRVTVNNIRKTLLQENFFQVVNLPNKEKLGLEIVALSHQGGIKESDPAVVFNVSGEREASSISFYANYSEYKKGQEKEGEQSHLPPKTLLIPIRELIFEKLDFASLLKHIFKLKVDF